MDSAPVDAAVVPEVKEPVTTNANGTSPANPFALTNGKVFSGASCANTNGFKEKNGFSTQYTSKAEGLSWNKKITVANGVKNEDVKMEDEDIVTNGINVIALTDDGMDVEETAGRGRRSPKKMPRTNGIVHVVPKQETNDVEASTSSMTIANVPSIQLDHNLKVGKEENMNEVANVQIPPPIVQKCANSKLLCCTLDASPTLPCKRCHRVFYCSEEHREMHFKDHKPDCKTVSSLEVIYYEDQYSMWLKHAAPHFYDTCLNFVLVWPSLTVQWLPIVDDLENNMLRHHILLGTMTNQEQNHLLVCGIDVMDRTRMDNNVSAHAAKYTGSMYVLKRINHEGEVNRARYMPQNPEIVATKSSSPEVFIFDCSKAPDVPENSNFSPLLRLKGHQKEGFGLSWSEKETGKLLSGSNDGVVCLWDINKNPTGKSNTTEYLDAVRIFRAHEDVVEDVDWNPEHKHIFASVGDDKRLIVWDTRVAVNEPPPLNRRDAHESDINVVSFSPFSEICLATGSSDNTVAVWDIRNINVKLHSLEFHRGEVMQVQWSPHCESILASTGKDNRVFMWDLSKVSKNDNGMSDDYDEDTAPNELAFIHGGHIANVNDISWNYHDMGMIASVTEDNILQVWKMSEELQASYRSDSEDESQGGAESDAMDDLDG